MKDWKGNGRTIVCLGASTYSTHDREENDYYATDPDAINYLFLKDDQFSDVWECACGAGHLAKRIAAFGKLAKASDIINRGYGEQMDFFDATAWHGDIITNPPYRWAEKFIEHGLAIIPTGRKIAYFLRLQFLESKQRYWLYKTYPPVAVYVFSGRISCAINGDFENMAGSAVPYAWFVWQKGYTGKTVIDWILVGEPNTIPIL